MDDDLIAESSSMDNNIDDDHAASTQIQMDIDVPRECTTSTRTQPINTNVSGRENKNGLVGHGIRQRMFLEPMSFKALFSATRVRPNTSFAAMNSSSGNSSKSSQDVDTSDKELKTNVPQEGRNNNFQSSRTNTVSQDNNDDSSLRSDTDPGMLLHTTITNSRANQEITTGLSIQSNVTNDQLTRKAQTIIPNMNRDINSISISRFPRSTDDNRRPITNINTNHTNRKISKYGSNSVINLHESEQLHTTGTRERVSSISPATDNRGRSIVTNQTGNSGFRQHIVGEMSGLVTSRPINLNDSWAGVELTANPNLHITWGIETTRQFIVPGNNASRQRQFPSYNGTGNNRRATNSNTSRMSIAYLCSNDFPGQDGVINSSRNENNLKLSSDGFLNINNKRICRVCREKFAPLPVNMMAHKCPRCLRHFSLYNLEWPLRKQPKEKGKAKETKNRNEVINRRDKKATPIATLITTTNNNKGKARQVTVPVSYIADKKEHNERMQAIIFAESNEEWLPIDGIDKEKYDVGEEEPAAGKVFR
ncbi:hypothetical protein C1645_539207 [Glomus cerebriforme]|uniref:Uncharacterized protein n=1 Tax=Glomus cerebriforme TaxID=658196 RepID=A0A397S5Y2_9GLOM|nr:hypothetical protein C1645_539207 [Glomus cerebriforme]